MRRDGRGPGPGSDRWVTTALLTSLCLAACRQALNTVFDVPLPQPTTSSAASPPAAAQAAAPSLVQAAEDSSRPDIERHLAPDSIVARLPRDHAGNIDWVAALRDSVIRPRPGLPGRNRPIGPGFEFAFDFTYQGPDTTFDAVFPHSSHTEWVACQQCHPRIFPYRNTPVTMTDVFQGKFCGECHGKVSFPVLTGCERCHRRMQLPAGRAKPDLIGTIQMARVKADSGNSTGVDAEGLPPARFPHAVHRIRYRCKACHVDLFEPRKGANLVTMQAISSGKACGVCHDGQTAFQAGFGACERCHIPPAAPVASP